MVYLGSITTKLEILTQLGLGWPRRPLWGQIFLTRRCNIRCPFCAAPTHPAGETSLKQWKAILDRLRHWGVRWLNIVGGEPTLYPDVWEFLLYAHEKGFPTVLHTNLYKVPPDFEDRVATSHVSAIEASLDSVDGSMPRSDWKTLDLLCRLRNRGVYPLVSTVITAENIHQISEIANRVTQRGIMYIAAVYQHVGGLFSENDVHLAPEPAVLQRTLNDLRRLKQRTGLIRNSRLFLENSRLHAEPQWHCHADRDSWVAVDSDGRLMACQEYKSRLHVLDIEDLKDSRWRIQKLDLASACRGCSYHCYYEAEELLGLRFLQELSLYVRKYYERQRRPSPPHLQPAGCTQDSDCKTARPLMTSFGRSTRMEREECRALPVSHSARVRSGRGVV